jgi:hypothetical protein
MIRGLHLTLLVGIVGLENSSTTIRTRQAVVGQDGRQPIHVQTFVSPFPNGNGDHAELPTKLVLYAGDEPIDVVHRYCVDHKLPRDTRTQIMNHLCSNMKLNGVVCSRSTPKVFSQSFTFNIKPSNEKRTLDRLDVFEDQEPIDAIHAYCKTYGLERSRRDQIMKHVCRKKGVVCTRTQPVLFSHKFELQGQVIQNPGSTAQ